MKIFLQCLVLALVVAVCFGQPLFAAERHFHVAVIPGSHHSEASTGPAAGLYGISAYFGAEPLNAPVGTANVNPWSGPYPGTTSATPPNDLWPCFGDNTAQPDCTYIGETAGEVYSPSTATSLPQQIVLGSPSYTWYLSANTATSQPYGCDATTASDTFHMCAQAINWYQDNSGDTTDELLWSIEVEQGTKIIYDSGTQDYGPNPYGGYLAATGVAPVIVFYEDLTFGLAGHSGASNVDGPCFQSYNYPSTVNGDPAGTYEGLVNTFGGLFGVTAGKTCVAPTSGLATVTITTWLAPATWTGVTVKSKCNAATMGAPPNSSSPYCYTVKYGTAAKANVVSQKFTIWLE